MKKRKRLYQRKKLLLLVTLVILLPARISHGAGNPETLIKFSPDGRAWTIREALPRPEDARNAVNPACWYPMGEEVITGEKREPGKPGRGEHAYSYERHGIVPISHWRVRHAHAQCIHVEVPGFHGVPGGGNRCHASYYSGWNPYCEDCGEIVGSVLFYLSRDTVGKLTTLNLDLDYYYLCPTCNHMEQGAEVRHVCKGISANRYLVTYLPNADDAEGEMQPSFHLYHNVELYEGENIGAQKALSPNAYERKGWQFVEWNLEPDGSGEGFGDGQEILNLSEENYDPATETGIVRLYAIWEPDSGKPLTEREIRTVPIEISSLVDGTEYGSVAGDGGEGFFVKADGVTPFTLAFMAEVKKGKKQQIDVLRFLTRDFDMEESDMGESEIETTGAWSEFAILVPRGEELAGELAIPSEALARERTGKGVLQPGNYSQVLRTDGMKRVLITQGFTMDFAGNGKQIRVTPGAGVKMEEEEVRSEKAADARNSILLTGDGEGPVIFGTESIPDQFVRGEEDGDMALMELWAEDALSGTASFQVEIVNVDHGRTETFYPEADGHVRIQPSSGDDLYGGDVRILIKAKDRVGNETVWEKNVREFALEAKIVRMLSPHEPVFQRGESGILIVTVRGYARKLEIDWPESFTEDDPDLPRLFSYEIPSELVREEMEFMVPLYLEGDGERQITVRAYKGEMTLECRPHVSVAGSVLEELRTRLR